MMPKGHSKSKYDLETKTFLADALKLAAGKERLSISKAFQRLGLPKYHTTRVTKPGYDPKRPMADKYWKRIEEWYNSGKTLRESVYNVVKTDPAYVKDPEPPKSSNGKPMTNVNDLFDHYYDGIEMAMKYGIPREKIPSFVKEVYMKKIVRNGHST